MLVSLWHCLPCLAFFTLVLVHHSYGCCARCLRAGPTAYIAFMIPFQTYLGYTTEEVAEAAAQFGFATCLSVLWIVLLVWCDLGWRELVSGLCLLVHGYMLGGDVSVIETSFDLLDLWGVLQVVAVAVISIVQSARVVWRALMAFAVLGKRFSFLMCRCVLTWGIDLCECPTPVVGSPKPFHALHRRYILRRVASLQDSCCVGPCCLK